MARMSGARWLGEHAPVQSDGKRLTMSRYDIVCIHTIVGFAPAHQAHFSVHHDGTIDQSRDTLYRSGANLEGNHRVIAIENEDHGAAFGTWDTDDGHAVPAFTAAQVEANAQILAWAHETHGVPLQLCPNSRSTSRGLAYHRQGIDGNFSDYDYPGRVSGGEVWTKSFGKVCPGDRRISARDRILARAKQIVEGDDDMTPEQDELLKYISRQVKATAQLITDTNEVNLDKHRASALRIESLFKQVLTEQGLTDDKIDEILAEINEQFPDPEPVPVEPPTP
jgi:N-acetylmuramoyl-L-alanine amidase